MTLWVSVLAAVGAAVGTGAGAIIGKKMDKAKAQAEAVKNAQVQQVTDINGLPALKVTFDSGILFSGTTFSRKRPNHKLHLIQKTSASCPIPGKACRCFSCYKVFSTRRTAFSGSSGIPPRFPGWYSPALQRYRAFPALQTAGWCGSPPCLPALHP